MIKETFFEILEKYSSDKFFNQRLWEEVEKNYSHSGRHYHTLTHLDNLLGELIPFKNQFSDWDAVIFAIVYHDVVYNTLKSNNEEKSAVSSVNTLTPLAVPANTIRLCEKFILATKHHEAKDEETNLFTDADLSILGSESSMYMQYASQIRKEYSIYPDLIYNPGRKKVLQHFLSMKSIFKSEEFASRYEAQARVNLEQELSLLK